MNPYIPLPSEEDPLFNQTHIAMKWVPFMPLCVTFKILAGGSDEPIESMLADIRGPSRSHIANYSPILELKCAPHRTHECGRLCSGQPHRARRVCRFCKIELSVDLTYGPLDILLHFRQFCPALPKLGQQRHDALLRLFLNADYDILQAARSSVQIKGKPQSAPIRQSADSGKRPVLDNNLDNDPSPKRRKAAVRVTPSTTDEDVPVLRKSARNQIQKDGASPSPSRSVTATSSEETSTATTGAALVAKVDKQGPQGRCNPPGIQTSAVSRSILRPHAPATSAVTEEQPAQSAWPADLAPYGPLLIKTGATDVEDLQSKLPTDIIEPFVDLLLESFPNDLSGVHNAWILTNAIKASQKGRGAGAPDQAAERVDPRFPASLNRHVPILQGLHIPSTDSLFQHTPFERIEEYVKYVSERKATKHLLPDMLTRFTFAHALRTMYKEAGHGPAEIGEED